MVKRLFGNEFVATAVLESLQYHNFEVPWLHSRKEPVAFEVGQPLGLYSSWPLFTLSHHLVVWVAAELCYPGRVFRKYALLGDDIVIADEGVHSEYRRLISGLGVDVSVGKTLESKLGA
ncbi:Mitovirus RNA-dependent RNA polymerase, partial [Striga hermonthica]